MNENGASSKSGCDSLDRANEAVQKTPSQAPHFQQERSPSNQVKPSPIIFLASAFDVRRSAFDVPSVSIGVLHLSCTRHSLFVTDTKLPLAMRESLGLSSAPDFWPYTVTNKFRHLRCARVGFWQGATKEHSQYGSVTEEQRSQKPTLAQPSGWPSFLPLPSLLAPYRPMTGMLVARASAAPKIPSHAGVEIYLSQYQAIQFT